MTAARLAILTALALAAFAGTALAQRPSTYVLPGEGVFPEGVAVGRGSSFFVSSVGRGTIFRGNLRRPRMRVLSAGGSDRPVAVGLEADARGRLWVAGGPTGRMYVIHARTGRTLRTFETGGAPSGFVNDVAITPRGDAYFTDSLRPVLYRIRARAARGRSHEPARAEAFIDLRDGPIRYETGTPARPAFNLNGIVASADGRTLLAVQSVNGRVFRIDVRMRRVSEVDLGGARLLPGDGMELRGRTLYVVRNQARLIVRVRLDRDLSSGRVQGTRGDPRFRTPTTIALTRDRRILVVNSQFAERGPGGQPELPFTVSAIPCF